MFIRCVLYLPVLLALVACEPTATPPAQPKAKSAVPLQAPAESPAAKPDSQASAPRAALLQGSEELTPRAVVAPAKPNPPIPTLAPEPEPEPAPISAPLDLKLHTNVFDPLQPMAPLNEQQHLLPPLFGQKIEPDNAFQLNGKLISNERDDDYWQSVEGAQLEFEFKQ